MAEIAIAAAISAAVSAAAYTVQYALTPKAKPIQKGRLTGDIQIQDSRYGHMIPILLGANPVNTIGGATGDAVSFVASTFKQGTGTTAVADKPSGTSPGDVILALVFSNNQSTVTPPAGWTLLSTQSWVTSGVTLYNHVYWKLAGSSEPATYTFSMGSGAPWVILDTYRGVDQTTPIQTFNTASVNSATSPDITFSSLTPARDGSRLVALISLDNVAAGFVDTFGGGLPTGFVEDHVQQGEGVHSKPVPTAGASGSITFTSYISGTPTNFGKAGVMLVLQPPAAADQLEPGGGMRIAGNVIYMSDVRKVETVTPAEGGKGFGNKNPDTVTTQYFCDLGIMFSEGEMSLAKLYAGTDLIIDLERASSTGFRDPDVDPDDDADNILLPDPTDTSIALRPAQRYGAVVAPDADGTMTGTIAAGSGSDFRFYSGSETQQPDPLLETHFGVGNTPAYLGRSYIVLENFEVGKYGAIPNFTAVLNNINLTTAAACIDHLCQRVGLEPSDYDVSNVTEFKVRGIPIVNREGPRNTVDLIGKLFGFDMVETDGEIVCVTRGGASSFAVTEDDLGTVEVEGTEDPQDEDLPELVVQERQLDQTGLPRRVDVNFFDPARNGENNTAGHTRLEAMANGFVTEDINAVLTFTEGRQLAQRLLDTAWIESAGAIRFRVPHTFASQIKAAAVGTVTRNGITHKVRIKEVNGFVPGVLEAVGIITAAATYDQTEISTGADAGAPVVTVTTPSIPATTVATFIDRILRDRELQDGRPGFYVAACSFGNGSWGSANVYADRGDGYVHLINVPEQATMGVVDATPSTIAGASTVDVVLYADQALPAGPAYVMQGELIYQYATATQLSSSPNLWRVTGLTDIGAKCTTAENGSHAAGERFVVLNQALRYVALESDQINVATDYKVPTSGADLNDTGVISFTVTSPNTAVTTPSDYAMTAGSAQITHSWTPFSDDCVMVDGLLYEIRADSSGSPGALIYSGPGQPFVETGLVAGTYTRHFRARTRYADGSYVMDTVTVTTSPGDGVDPDGVSSAYEDLITRFYQAAFVRDPTAGEMTMELGLLTSAVGGLAWYRAAVQIGNRLFTSAEYIARGRTNAQFVDDCYQAYLDRDGEAAGVAAWIAALVGGTTRAAVAAAFGDSSEFRTVHCLRIYGWRPENYWLPMSELRPVTDPDVPLYDDDDTTREVAVLLFDDDGTLLMEEVVAR